MMDATNDEVAEARYSELHKLIDQNQRKLKEIDSATGSLEQDISLIN